MKKRVGSIMVAVILIIMQFAGIFSAAAIVKAKDNRPRILLDSYEITEGRLVPGGTVTIKFTFKNTSTSITANNLLITYSGSDNIIQPEDGEANQFYIDEINPAAYKNMEVQMKISENVTLDTENLTKEIASKVEFNISYLYDQARETHEASNDTFIILPITQECVMDVKSLSVADTAVIGSKSLVSLVCANSGTTPVSNVVMHIDGNILEEQKEVEIGNIPVNSQQALDYYVNLQSEGNQKLEIYFSYEDEKGIKFKSVKKEYNVYVTGNETVVPTDDTNLNVVQNNDGTSTGFELSLSNICILGAATIALILIIAFIIKRKRGE